MRTAVACLVLASAIATPGIVVAATGSTPQQVGLIVGGGSAVLHQVGLVGAPIDPRLRPTVNAVTRALARTGVHLQVFSAGPHSAEGVEVGSHGRCPVSVTFGQRLAMYLGGPCPTGEIDSRIGPIDFVPASLGPAIRRALAR